MRLPATAKWIGLALLGLVIAAAVAIAASHLASQQIGISSEPIEAGNALAPKRGEPSGHDKGGEGERTTPATPETTSETTAPETTTAPESTTGPESTSPPSEPGDDGGGSSHGGSGGHGADD